MLNNRILTHLAAWRRRVADEMTGRLWLRLNSNAAGRLYLRAAAVERCGNVDGSGRRCWKWQGHRRGHAVGPGRAAWLALLVACLASCGAVPPPPPDVDDSVLVAQVLDHVTADCPDLVAQRPAQVLLQPVFHRADGVVVVRGVWALQDDRRGLGLRWAGVLASGLWSTDCDGWATAGDWPAAYPIPWIWAW